MFKKINIITNIVAAGTVTILILYGHFNKDFAAFPLIGITSIMWFIVIFCSHRKKNINAQE